MQCFINQAGFSSISVDIGIIKKVVPKLISRISYSMNICLRLWKISQKTKCVFLQKKYLRQFKFSIKKFVNQI